MAPLPLKVKRTKENTIERALVRRVQQRGGMCIKVQAVGVRGLFDRLIVLPGPRIIFCEVKRPVGGRISPHQMQYHREFDALGVAVVYVRTLEDIDLMLSPPA